MPKWGELLKPKDSKQDKAGNPQGGIWGDPIPKAPTPEDIRNQPGTAFSNSNQTWAPYQGHNDQRMQAIGNMSQQGKVMQKTQEALTAQFDNHFEVSNTMQTNM